MRLKLSAIYDISGIRYQLALFVSMNKDYSTGESAFYKVRWKVFTKPSGSHTSYDIHPGICYVHFSGSASLMAPRPDLTIPEIHQQIYQRCVLGLEESSEFAKRAGQTAHWLELVIVQLNEVLRFLKGHGQALPGE